MKDLAPIVIGGITALVALGTLLKAVVEYGQQGRQRRAEHFVGMRRRFTEDQLFKSLCAQLEADDPKLADVPFADKRVLLGFFEEIALMLNSGLIAPDVANYMFGYYAVVCWRSDNFWSNVNRESRYWSFFQDFVAELSTLDDGLASSTPERRRRVLRF